VAHAPVAVENGAFVDRLPEIYLHPGQQYVATSPALLKMILGSCAGVFLFDPKNAVGGATHFMLPNHGSGPASPRYGDIAVSDLLGRFRALGSDRKNLVAKVFGGGSMLSALRNMPGNQIGHIGQRNVDIAIEMLAEAAIRIIEKDVLGKLGRMVSMVSSTGEINVEYLGQADGSR
jgi:chemotaxis protein CheD